MKPKSKPFWIGLSLLNLSLVALYGLLMRSKMIFSIPILDYRNLLSAHSHFAFGGWVGLAIITLLVYDVLPKEQGEKKVYQGLLWGIHISSLGMGLSFPFMGYTFVSIAFSTLYILVSFYFAWAYFTDVKKAGLPPVVRWLALGAVGSLVLSSIGPAGLSYILLTKSGNSLLYRDFIYTFLHLQYNGFFTLGVFAVFFSNWLRRGVLLPPAARQFALFLLLSVLPSLFVALLWHNLVILYVLAALGCLFIVISVGYFLPVFRQSLQEGFFRQPLARVIWMASFVSFGLKMVLIIGTLYPPLGNAVYGARPVIIGFLHLVFLAFVSFFILSICLEEGYFSRDKKLLGYPVVIFGLGVVINEAGLMIQGLEILFKNNSIMYNWLLWGGAILLFAGATLMAAVFYQCRGGNKKAAASTATSL